jgi:hypothetical protein
VVELPEVCGIVKERPFTMHDAVSLVADDATRGYDMSSAVGRFLPQPKMGTILVVIANKIREQTLEMSLT